jgi:hypothetical protein
MVKTADDNESGERFMRIVDEELLMQRRDTVSCYYFYGSLQGFYTMVQVPYETALDTYVQREYENGHMKLTAWQGNVWKYKGKERMGTQE